MRKMMCAPYALSCSDQLYVRFSKIQKHLGLMCR